jgi:Fe-S-cluster containining protein
MNSYVNNRKDVYPNGLCRKCGRCCKVIVNPDYTYEELTAMREKGEEYAKEFLNLFEPYPSVEAAKRVDEAAVNNIIEKLKSQLYNTSNITFYHCRYISSDNLCAIYEERPEICAKYPATGWVVVPPKCGYEAWGFIQRENDMQAVRKAKEAIIDLDIVKNKSTDPHFPEKIESVRKKLNSVIDTFYRYGSNNW